MNYYVIPMDFNRYSFLDLLKEWRKHRHVIWEAYGEVDNDSNDKPFIKKTSKIARSMEKGDVIYIYVFNLPSVNAKNKARILLRGTVKKRPYPVKRSEACYTDATDDTDDDWIIGFQIENLITLKESNLRNDIFLSREDLKERFGFLNPQGSRWPNTVTDTPMINWYSTSKKDSTTPRTSFRLSIISIESVILVIQERVVIKPFSGGMGQIILSIIILFKGMQRILRECNHSSTALTT